MQCKSILQSSSFNHFSPIHKQAYCNFKYTNAPYCHLPCYNWQPPSFLAQTESFLDALKQQSQNLCNNLTAMTKELDELNYLILNALHTWTLAHHPTMAGCDNKPAIYLDSSTCPCNLLEAVPPHVTPCNLPPQTNVLPMASSSSTYLPAPWTSPYPESLFCKKPVMVKQPVVCGYPAASWRTKDSVCLP